MDAKTSILVADDDRLILALIAHGLRRGGFDVIEASSGADAIRLAEELKPELALLDVNMPEMSGLEVAKHLRDHTDVACLFLSAYSDDETVKTAAECGALGYLVKPADVAQILPPIHAALARAREIRALRKESEDLVGALERGRDINRAIGVLMERYGFDRDTAFAELRDEARRRRRKISELAEQLLQAVELANFPMIRRKEKPGGDEKT